MNSNLKEAMPEGMLQLVAQVLNADKLSSRFLDQYADGQFKIAPWSISRSADSTDPTSVLGHSGAYLTYADEDSDKAHAYLKEVLIDQLVSSSSKGMVMANAILLLSRLDRDDVAYDFMLELIAKIDWKEKKEASNVLRAVINSWTWMPNTRPRKSPLSLEEWGDLIHAAQYASPIGNPCPFFAGAVASLNANGVMLALLGIVPQPRVLLLECTRPSSLHTDASELEEQRNVGDNSAFLAAYLLSLPKTNEKLPLWINKELMTHIVIDNWDTIGREIFRNTFGHLRSRMNEDLLSVLDSSARVAMKNPDVRRRLLGEMLWPQDFEALAMMEEDFLKLNLDADCTEILVRQVTEATRRMLESVGDALHDQEQMRTLVPYGISSIEGTRCMILARRLLMTASEPSFSEWLKASRELLYAVKTLYYGEHGAVLVARRITEFFLLVATCPSKSPNSTTEKERLNRLSELIDKTILYPYVRATEVEPEARTGEARSPYVNQELALLSAWISKTVATKNENPIIDRMRVYATAKWSWM